MDAVESGRPPGTSRPAATNYEIVKPCICCRLLLLTVLQSLLFLLMHCSNLTLVSRRAIDTRHRTRRTRSNRLEFPRSIYSSALLAEVTIQAASESVLLLAFALVSIEEIAKY
jgi:hypothetical protein